MAVNFIPSILTNAFRILISLFNFVIILLAIWLNHIQYIHYHYSMQNGCVNLSYVWRPRRNIVPWDFPLAHMWSGVFRYCHIYDLPSAPSSIHDGIILHTCHFSFLFCNKMKATLDICIRFNCTKMDHHKLLLLSMTPNV